MALVIVAMLGLLGLANVLGALTGIASFFARLRAPIEIVAVRVISDPLVAQSLVDQASGRLQTLEDAPPRADMSGFPLLDVRLRNRGDESIVLTAIRFAVRRISREEIFHFCSPLAPKWNYHVLFDPRLESGINELDISQVIEPKGADRFLVTVGHSVDARARYAADLTIVYDGQRTLALGRVMVSVDGPPCGLGGRLRAGQPGPRAEQPYLLRRHIFDRELPPK